MGTTQDYFDAVPEALLNFQMLEEAIRNYLARCEFFTYVRMKGIIDIDMTRDLKIVDKASLGTLVDMFERRNKNGELIDQLRKIIPERNFFAHEAYTNVFEKGEVSETKAALNHERLTRVINDSNDCFLAVWKETSALEKRMAEKHNAGNANTEGKVDPDVRAQEG